MDQDLAFHNFIDSNQTSRYILFAVGCNVEPVNYISSEHMSASNRPSKRSKEAEDTSRQQKLQISLNSFFQCHVDKSSCIPNANVISTGQRLSYDDDKQNSSVTSASENMSTLPVILSLGDNLRTEFDNQEEELNRYIMVQVCISRILLLEGQCIVLFKTVEIVMYPHGLDIPGAGQLYSFSWFFIFNVKLFNGQIYTSISLLL